jgi:catechol-2,3-dioxygenase
MKIIELILETSTLKDAEDFYTRTLGLALHQKHDNGICIKAGASLLTFRQAKAGTHPYYHFAFNISAAKHEKALQWLEDKEIKINEVSGKKIMHSASWNSDSIYFYDLCGNVVEFIARHNIPSEAMGEFTAYDVISISEVGLPVDDVDAAARLIMDETGESIFHNRNEVFSPIGDDNGLFIVTSSTRKWLGSDRRCRVFPISVRVQTIKPIRIIFSSQPYSILASVSN